MIPHSFSWRGWATILGSLIAFGCWSAGARLPYTCGQLGTTRTIWWAAAVLMLPLSVGIALPWRNGPWRSTILTLTLFVLAVFGVLVSALSLEADNHCGSF
jgi:hypothetical protein